VALEPMPLNLGDFIYAYAEAATQPDHNHRVRYGIRRLEELRGHPLFHGLPELSERITTALVKRDKRRQAQCPLPLFPSWAQNYRNYARAWHTHQSGEQLLLVFDRLQVDHKLLVRAGCDCARIALLHVPEGENRPRTAIETTEAWCDGRATIEQVRVAAHDARAAADAADGAAADAADGAASAAYVVYADYDAVASYAAVVASYAAYAAADAADGAAYAAADAADGAASAAYAVAAYASYAAYAAAQAAYAANATRNKTQAHCADLVRARIPWSEVRDAIRAHETRKLP